MMKGVLNTVPELFPAISAIYFVFLCEISAYVIGCAHADLGCELDAVSYQSVPVLTGQAVQVIAAYVTGIESVQDSGIEIVTCSDGAYGDYGLGTDAVLLSVVYHQYTVASAGADESGAVL